MPTHIEARVAAAVAGGGDGAVASGVAAGAAVDRAQLTKPCTLCKGGVGVCRAPDGEGHLSMALAYCLPCSGKRAKAKGQGNRHVACLCPGQQGHWPIRDLPAPTDPAGSVGVLGGLPSDWADAAVARDSRPAPAQTAVLAVRELFVLSLLHDADAKPGSVMGAVLPGGRPGRHGREESGIKVSDNFLNGTFASPSETHKIPAVQKMLREVAAGAVARRFVRELISGARPLSEAITPPAPVLTVPVALAVGAAMPGAAEILEKEKQAAKARLKKIQHLAYVLEVAKSEFSSLHGQWMNIRYGRVSQGNRPQVAHGTLAMLEARLKTANSDVEKAQANLHKFQAGVGELSRV